MTEVNEAAGVQLEYVGFWRRFWASLIDSILLLLIIMPILLTVYGTDYLTSDKLIHGPMDFLLQWVVPAFVVILFWMYKQATPGKMAFSAKVVDAATGKKPSTGQFIGRYLAYYLATLPLFLGLVWVAFDPRKQGWHDKLAGTVVVRPKRGPQGVTFSRPGS